MGFSADVLFTAEGKQVERILKVFSLDVVIHPARGGAFVRLLNVKRRIRSQACRKVNPRRRKR